MSASQSLTELRYASSGVHALQDEDASHVLTTATQHWVGNFLTMRNLVMLDSIAERAWLTEPTMLG